MRKYWEFLKIAYQVTIFYRTAVILRLVRDLMTPLIFIIVWAALYRNTGNIDGYTFPMMVTYYILVKVFDQFYSFEPSGMLNKDVQTGDLSNYLLKPLSYIICRVFYAMGRRIARVFLTVVAVVVIFILFPSYVSYPTSIIEWVGFLITMAASWILLFELAFLVGELAFWFTQVWNLRSTFEHLIAILGGLWVPLNFFPPTFRDMVELLPFKYLYYYPVQVFQGKIATQMILRGILVELTWVLLLAFCVKLIWDRGVTRYESYGR